MWKFRKEKGDQTRKKSNGKDTKMQIKAKMMRPNDENVNVEKIKRVVKVRIEAKRNKKKISRKLTEKWKMKVKRQGKKNMAMKKNKKLEWKEN